MLISRKAFLISGVTLALAANVASGAPAKHTSSTNIPVEQLRFYKSRDGLIFANAWGDPASGPHSNFIKLAARYVSPLHVHTSSYYGVVVTGVVANERRGHTDRALRPGSYWFQQGGEPHVTKCLSNSECLIFVTSKGKFDIRVVPDPAPTDRGAGNRP